MIFQNVIDLSFIDRVLDDLCYLLHGQVWYGSHRQLVILSLSRADVRRHFNRLALFPCFFFVVSDDYIDDSIGEFELCQSMLIFQNFAFEN